MIEELLIQFGLTENEAVIFLCLNQHQKLNGARITATTHIKRATVYTVLRELVKKGLVIEDFGGATRYYSPIAPESLVILLQKQESELRNKKQLLSKIVQELHTLPSSKNFSIPKIRFIPELQLQDFLVNESEKWFKSGEKNDSTWWGFQDASLLDEYPQWPEYFFSKFSGKTKLKILTNKKPLELRLRKEFEDRREMKYISNEEFTATHVVIGDYILMIMTRQHPHYLIEIRDAVMSNNLREIFKRLWKKE